MMRYIKALWDDESDIKRRSILIITCFITVGMFSSFVYSDIAETTRYGITLCDALLSGHLREFYIMNSNIMVSNNFGIGGGAVYDFPLYAVFGIWAFPLWLYEKMTGSYALDTLFGLLWAKAISFPFLFGIYIYIIKIGIRIKSDNFSKYAALTMMFSSTMYMIAFLIMGQYDSLSLLFIMIGIYNYIDNNNRRFILSFGIAMLFKGFAMFIFIPLILMKNKKILNILFQVMAGSSMLIISKLLQNVYFFVDETVSDYYRNHFLQFIFQSQLGFAYNGISLFFVGFIVLCMYCYFKKTPDDDLIGKWTIFISFLALANFFITSLTHPQWSLLLVPFATLLVCCNDEMQMKTGLWVDTIFSIGLLFAAFVYYSWVFNIKTSVYTLAGKIFYDGSRDINYSISDYISSFLQGIDIGYLRLAAGGIFVAGVLFFIFWAYPEQKKDKYAELPISIDFIILTRLVVMVFTYSLLVLLMI